jgi:hypothetical protein
MLIYRVLDELEKRADCQLIMLNSTWIRKKSRERWSINKLIRLNICKHSFFIWTNKFCVIFMVGIIVLENLRGATRGCSFSAVVKMWIYLKYVDSLFKLFVNITFIKKAVTKLKNHS